MTHGILVPLDGSPFAERALPYATLLAKRSGAELLLARIVHLPGQAADSGAETVWGRVAKQDPADPSPRTHQREHTFEEATEYLRALQTTVAAEVPGVQPFVEAGDAPQALLEIAKRGEVSLIVMATHGRSGLTRWVMGSVAEQLLRRTHVPVLLLAAHALDAGGPERLQQRLAVPTDGSGVSEQIFPVAQGLARRLQVPVTLVQAVEAAPFLNIGPLGMPNTLVPAETIQAAEEGARTALADLAAAWTRDGVQADAVVAIGEPASVIVQAAEQRQAGWIAMSSHGRGDLGGFVLGSTALAVLRRAKVPVLVAVSPHEWYRLGGDE